ncbi:hypothetical protein [Salinibacter ruber]|uniref:hypothetical protein n=1 Tax=Salinibacter ruber TaxID=146919 RepID=UPI002074A95D|nr:hypothetical protein [Salinibacter ruber]
MDASTAPYVSVQVPRQPEGEKFIGGGKRLTIRQPIRVHTRHKPQRADRGEALRIASAIDEALNAAPIRVGGRAVHIPVPRKRPVPPYDVAGKKAYDLSIRYEIKV